MPFPDQCSDVKLPSSDDELPELFPVEWEVSEEQSLWGLGTPTPPLHAKC